MSQTSSDLTTEQAGEQTGTLELTESERHRLLSDDRRRVALEVLPTRTTPIELEELARAIATREVDAEEPESEYVDRVAITLHHSHLPKMAHLDVIDYDPESKRIVSLR